MGVSIYGPWEFHVSKTRKVFEVLCKQVSAVNNRRLILPVTTIKNRRGGYRRNSEKN